MNKDLDNILRAMAMIITAVEMGLAIATCDVESSASREIEVQR